MDNTQISQDVREKSEKIEAIYEEAIIKVKEFEKQQKQVITDFIKDLEQRKIEELRKKLSDK